jgi:acetoin utilization deacetylase AcuC-like enzyme
MTTLLITHDDCLEHDTGAYHPERPDRLRAVLKAMEQDVFRGLKREEAPRASFAAMARAHPGDFVVQILDAIPAHDLAQLDADTVISAGSGEAMQRAAGAVVRAVDAVAKGEARNAFCAVRPPGHHAESTRAMGFCLVNNVVVGALHARAVHGHKRIAVVDFDVHHGNGTQEMFWDDAEAFYASTHQYPFYPGTGSTKERGAHGNIVNVPLAAGTGPEVFRSRFSGELLPALEAFRPDILLISAGFDAHKDDPLAELRLTESDFAWATAGLMDVARKQCGGRVVSVLEGGYNLDALADCATAHVQTLKDH